jgi:hypothetical protein
MLLGIFYLEALPTIKDRSNQLTGRLDESVFHSREIVSNFWLQFTKLKNRQGWLVWVLTKPNSRPAAIEDDEWLIVHEMEIALQNTENLIGRAPCLYGKRLDRGIFGIADKKAETDFYRNVKRAWRVNTTTGKLDLLTPQKVACTANY